MDLGGPSKHPGGSIAAIQASTGCQPLVVVLLIPSHSGCFVFAVASLAKEKQGDCLHQLGGDGRRGERKENEAKANQHCLKHV